MSYEPLDNKNMRWLEQESERRIKQFTEPRQLLIELLQALHDRKIKVPSYYIMSELISRQYINYENRLLDIIKEKLIDDTCEKLYELLKNDKARVAGNLNQLKVINQSTRPKAIQASLNVFNTIKELHEHLYPVICDLSLTPQSCSYYATWVKKVICFTIIMKL